MNSALEAFADEQKNRSFTLSVSHSDYLSWMNSSDVLVGNSSSGIIEAASFDLPVVNIGNRQNGRLRSGNVVDVPYDVRSIREAVEESMQSDRSCKNLYGDGTASERITAILEEISL